MNNEFNLKKTLKHELALNNEGWKRKLAIKAYRYKFYYYHIRPNKFRLKLAKIYSAVISFIIRSNIPTEKVYIDSGLKIPHAFDNIIITHHARLGKNLTIFHDVTIGVNENEETFPGDIIIEDDVLIGAGAKIIGKCKIGRGSKIGANALIVSETIPEYSLVVAPKAIIIPSKFKTSTATD